MLMFVHSVFLSSKIFNYYPKTYFPSSNRYVDIKWYAIQTWNNNESMSVTCWWDIGINMIRFMQVNYHSGDISFSLFGFGWHTGIWKSIQLMIEPYELSYNNGY